MTEEEKQAIVEAVIEKLSENRKDISVAELKEDALSAQSVVGYDSNGNIVRIKPQYFVDRIQGKGEFADSRNDNFKKLNDIVESDTTIAYNNLNVVLNSLTFDANIRGNNLGNFRINVNYRELNIRNILLSSGLNIVEQTIEGMFAINENNQLVHSDEYYSFATRQSNRGVWGQWSISYNSSTAARLNDIEKIATEIKEKAVTSDDIITLSVKTETQFDAMKNNGELLDHILYIIKEDKTQP